MNEPSTNSFFVVLLFVLRCLVPLAILFGISYLLRRMGLVAIEAPEPKEEVEKQPIMDAAKTSSTQKLTSPPQPKKPQKSKTSPPGKNAAPSRKKPAGKKVAAKTKTGNSRSRSK